MSTKTQAHDNAATEASRKLKLNIINKKENRIPNADDEVITMKNKIEWKWQRKY